MKEYGNLVMESSEGALRGVTQLLQAGAVPIRSEVSEDHYIDSYFGCALSQIFSAKYDYRWGKLPQTPGEQFLTDDPESLYDARGRVIGYFDSMTTEERIEFWPKLQALLEEYYVGECNLTSTNPVEIKETINV